MNNSPFVMKKTKYLDVEIPRDKMIFKKFYSLGKECNYYGNIYKDNKNPIDLIGTEKDLLPYWLKVYYGWCHRAVPVAIWHDHYIYEVSECPFCGAPIGCMIYRNISVCSDCYSIMTLADFIQRQYDLSKGEARRRATSNVPDRLVSMEKLFDFSEKPVFADK